MENLQKFEKLDDILALEVAQRHSYFQLKYFLIGKEPTNQAKMWQCLRELKARKDSLDNLILEQEDTKDQLELLKIEEKRFAINPIGSFGIQQEPDELDKKANEIYKRKNQRNQKSLQFKLEQLEKKKMYTEQEMLFFLETFKNIQNIEPLKNFDDLESQKAYWSAKLSNKVNLKMLTSNQIDTELIDTIMALPDDIPLKKQTINTLTAKRDQMVEQLKQLKAAKEINGSN